MKKFLSLILALVMCLGLSNAALALTVEEGISVIDWDLESITTTVEKDDLVYETDAFTAFTTLYEYSDYYSMKPGTPITVSNTSTDPDVIINVYFLKYTYISEPMTVLGITEDGEMYEYEINNAYYGSDAECYVLTDRTDHGYTDEYLPGGSGLYWLCGGFQGLDGYTVQDMGKCLHAGESMTFTLPQFAGEDTTYKLFAEAYYPSLDDGKQSCLFYSWSMLKLDGSNTPNAVPDVPIPTMPPDFRPDGLPEFADVAPTAYYAAPVTWAVGNSITAGTSATTFSPASPCTQQQILTFLYRAQRNITGTPAPASSEDLTNALNWAKEKGMINDSFDPNAVCTRATAVSYIWQAMDKPEAAASSFNDVSDSASYAAAVSWAVENSVTSGTGNGNFSPDKACDRGTIMTFLYRAFAQ